MTKNLKIPGRIPEILNNLPEGLYVEVSRQNAFPTKKAMRNKMI